MVVQPGTAGGGVNEQERILEIKKKIVIYRVTFEAARNQVGYCARDTEGISRCREQPARAY